MKARTGKVALKQSYELLELEEGATVQQVRKAFRKISIKYHPDKVQANTAEKQQAANEHYRKIVEAYEVVLAAASKDSPRKNAASI